ncbi:MAG: flagellar basal body rod protein FlgC [Veillonellaceae bacterium]|nr:flagellar basal body rod protein FlgC [Veillonellaceae bacterium]
MSIFGAIDVAASGMTAERLRLDVISNNIANVNTTRTVEGGPYRRQFVVFESRQGDASSFSSVMAGQLQMNGVRVSAIKKDDSPVRMVYEPGHPDADANGYVQMPNINIVTEMVDMMTASRAYEANVTSVNVAKSMMLKALEIGK